jgi:hypothetical protein
MSRGGRRRRTKRGIRIAGTEAQRSVADSTGTREPVSAQGRRSQSRPTVEREAPVLETMHSRPKQVHTLPPDGLVLEELIAGMQGEYGVPSTPQEYRLLIKTASSDDSVEQPPTEVRPPPREFPSGEGSRPRTGRRRRRPRNGMGTAAAMEGGSEALAFTGTDIDGDSTNPPPAG